MMRAIRIILTAAIFLTLATGIVGCYPQNEIMAESAAAYRTPLADAATVGDEDTYAPNGEGENDINPNGSDGEGVDLNENEATDQNINDGNTASDLTSDENEATDPNMNDEDTASDLTSDENEATDSDKEATDSDKNEGNTVDTYEIADPDEDEGEPMPGNSKNGFEQIYDTVIMHISEILSLAAFIGSLICAIIYKSGLMPLIENGLLGLKNAAVKIKEATDRAESDNKESINGISDRITDLEETIADMGEAFGKLREALSGLEDQKAHQTRLDTVLTGELDMLYDIFMTSSLPEYEKARVGERMTKLKGVLNSGGSEK